MILFNPSTFPPGTASLILPITPNFQASFPSSPLLPISVVHLQNILYCSREGMGVQIFASRTSLPKAFLVREQAKEAEPYLCSSKALHSYDKNYDFDLGQITKRSPSWKIAQQKNRTFVQSSGKKASKHKNIQDRIAEEVKQSNLKRKVHRLQHRKNKMSKMELMKSLPRIQEVQDFFDNI